MNARMHLSGAHASHQPDDGERIAVAVEVLGLLADRTRLALLRRLGESEADVTTLTEATDATRTSVSQHLARLRLAGLVTTRKEGRRMVYALRHGHLRHLVDEALNVADHRSATCRPMIDGAGRVSAHARSLRANGIPAPQIAQKLAITSGNRTRGNAPLRGEAGADADR